MSVLYSESLLVASLLDAEDSELEVSVASELSHFESSESGSLSDKVLLVSDKSLNQNFPTPNCPYQKYSHSYS